MASYTISPIWGAGAQLFDNSGRPLSGGKIYTYQAGTTTPAVTYTTPTGSVANSNPIVADSAGRLTDEIWVPVSGAYKFVLKTANDVTLATYDNIPTTPQPPITNDASNISYEQGYEVTAGGFTVGAIYLITSIGSTDFTLIGAASNTVGIHFIATGVGSGAGTAKYSRYVQNKLQENVSVKDFGAIGDGLVDDTIPIQAAIDSGAAKIYFPKGTYTITSPIYIDTGVYLYGDGSRATYVTKITNTAGTGSNKMRGGTVTDSYAVNAILICRHLDDIYNYDTTIKGIAFAGITNIVTYGIYAPRMSHLIMEDVHIFRTAYGYYTYDTWLSNFTKVIANAADAFTVGGGFVWDNDGSGQPTGTSVVMDNCYARNNVNGYYFWALVYSTLNGCACDNINKGSAYKFILSQMTLNGCGAENIILDAASDSAVIYAGSSSLTLNNFRSIAITGAANASYLYANISSIILNNPSLVPFAVSNGAYNATIQNGSQIVVSQPNSLNLNGNSYTSYTGSSTLCELGNPILLTNQAGTKSVYGSTPGTTIIEKQNKTILSTGTVICTLTAATADSVEMAAVQFTVYWWDNAYASGVGVSTFQAAVYYDNGLNYNQSINTTINTFAGNGIGAGPVYTIARSGDTWSITMTPSTGNITCQSITAEIYNYAGITVELP